jgi:hypothetical protein
MKVMDIHGEVSTVRMVDPAAVTATALLGTYFDLQSYQGRVKLTAIIGAVSGTTPTLDLKVQDCDTSGGTYADISPAVAFPQLVAASANTVASIGLDVRACRRFVKIYGTIGGTSTPTFTFGVTATGQKQVI